ncbi:MAG TPA: zinc-dependent metalloprotease [Woeseiaceae bacterium]|nr:zinc-dependent metalloprotease [Woeseiaceae bacterium]
MTQGRMAGLALVLLAGCGGVPPVAEPPAPPRAADAEDGFIDLHWDDRTGRLSFAVEAFGEPFIYQSSLARGVGSNDLGLDRGQLGETRLVRFEQSGNKVLLVQDNLDYRAQSDDPDERQAVAESFARSVIWGFEVTGESGDGVLVDGTDFFLRDAHGLAARLAARGEGTYRTDASRSAIFLPRTRAFPDNTEVEAIVTFTGEPSGSRLATVTPDAGIVTVHLHHSFVRLPADGYDPLPYDPRAGVIGLGYDEPGFIDYAAPIGDPLFVNFGLRHRLEKTDPAAPVSDVVEPIVYYVDRGAPEPVRAALIDGASWWNQAFEAAGFRNAFEVRVLPPDADPMDVRYNVIQWVHRSTRGWSYGSSIVDPRTGEIMKGHVTLGSLRVRQDYMIAEGLLAPYAGPDVPGAMLEMSLARIRQLSAHEVGHTLGFEHNFAASTQDRASVMDYPAPLVRFDPAGGLDLSEAYAAGIGEWDKRAVLYAYQDFPAGVDENAARAAILAETVAAGWRYVADGDARAVGTAHPHGNLWDNGEDALAELEHVLAVRAYALDRFSERNIRYGRPDALLEDVLVPLYLLHRYQLQAAGKLVGGVWFDYSVRGGGEARPRPVEAARQQAAIDALVATLAPGVLALPAEVASLIPPRPPGFPPTRELFAGNGGVFDPLAPAAAATALTLEVLLDPARAARLTRQAAPTFGSLVDELLAATWLSPGPAGADALRMQTASLVLDALLRLAVDETAAPPVRGTSLAAVDRIYAAAAGTSGRDALARAWLASARYRIERMREDPASVAELPEVPVPPGSPIGSASAPGGWE